MTSNLADYAAGQLRAELARRKITNAELARRLGVDETWVRRHKNGEAAIDMGDLERICEVLDLPPTHFIAASAAA